MNKSDRLPLLSLSSCADRPCSPSASPWPRLPSTVKIAPLPEKEYDPAVWGKKYPLEYKSFQRNLEMRASPTGFGGSVPYQKSTKEPEILVNFKGMPFSKDYAEDRGHPYALEDIEKTKRVTPQTSGSCMTCKTADLIDIWQRDGVELRKNAGLRVVPEAEALHRVRKLPRSRKR